MPALRLVRLAVVDVYKLQVQLWLNRDGVAQFFSNHRLS